jgi:hypothetical protein
MIRTHSYDWIRSIGKDFTCVVDIDHDETILSPRCTPLVLDEEVLVTVGCKFTPTDGKNTVINLSTATLRKDT